MWKFGWGVVDAGGHRVVRVGTANSTERRTTTMADDLRMALLERLRKAEPEDEADFRREGVRVLGQALLELEVSRHVGADKHARPPERPGQRNGYRDRTGDTRVGTIRAAGAPGARRQLLPLAAGAAQAGRAGAGGGGAGGVRAGQLDPTGGRPGAGARAPRGRQEPGLAAVPGAGCRGGALQPGWTTVRMDCNHCGRRGLIRSQRNRSSAGSRSSSRPLP